MIFRYPGGKSRVSKIIADKFKYKIKDKYAEPFVGGGSVALEIAERYPKAFLFLNDLDPWVSSVWDVISNPYPKPFEDLLTLIKVKPTIDMYQKMREEKPLGSVQMAFYAIFFNRTSFSGILDAGPIGGKAQKSKWGVGCRYNSVSLEENLIKARYLLAGRACVFNMHFQAFLNFIPEVPLYADPPYYLKGKELYRHHMHNSEHFALSDTLQGWKKYWLASYDDCPEIRAMYSKSKIEEMEMRYSINGKKSQWAKKSEILIYGA